MELHNQKPGAFGDQDSAELQDGGASAAVANRGASRVLVADASGVVVLPAGTELGDIRIEGRDLVVVGADGVRYVIPDGAIIVPQIVIDDVAIPPLNLAALLIGNEPQPAAGAPQSSGGNFASAVGPLQPAYGLGDLLPYTELTFPEPEEQEIIPQRPDREPTITVITVDQPVGAQNATASVAESGLPARNGEPAGSNAAATTETTTGTVVFSSPDGVTAITINGVAFTGVGQTISSPRGTLQITSYDPVAGTIGFSYTLTDNLVGATLADEFVFAVRDPDGDVATATLTVSAIDDVPTARNDTDLVPAGSYAAQTGNVITAAGTTSGAPGADTVGADNATVSRIASNNVAANTDTTFDTAGNLQVAGQYGTLLIKADGSYSYTRSAGTPGGVNDVFTYTLTDADGSASTATLTITIADATPVITSVPPTGSFDAGTLVFEAGLPSRPGEAPGTNAAASTETTSGTVTFTGGDGPVTATINGVNAAPGATVTVPGVGTLTVNTFNPTTGVITYSFTLADNTSGDNTSVTFNVVVTDVDGDTAPGTFTIAIRDDSPTAVNDSANQATENAPVPVDLLANDVQGADSVQPGTVTVVPGTLSGTGTLVNNGNGTVIYTPGPGESGTVTFDYTITDGDGDMSRATATIVLLADSTPTIAVSGDNTVDEAALPARPGEPSGSNAASPDETAAGSIAITTGGDTIGSLVINGVNVTNGGNVTTAKGVLTISVANGAYSYSYTLTDNTLTDPDSDTFTLTVTDSDGDPATTTLVISIADDMPSAEDDAGSIAAGAYGPITGSVTANDTPGADGIVVVEYSGVTSGAAGTIIDGQYGKLSIAPDGTYSYTRNPGTPGGVTDTFTYTVRDGDGDEAMADLVITIGNSGTTLNLPVAGTPGSTQVLEEGLAAGSNASSNGEFATGSFSFTAPDGPAVVTIDGTPITAVGQTITGSFGTLTITSIAAGSIGYTYELTTNTSGDNTFDSFAVVVADQDTDSTSGTLRINIVDDVPTPNPDIDSVTEDGPLTATGNVITGVDVIGGDANTDDGVADVQGADGAMVTAIAFNPVGGAAVAGTVNGSTPGTYGTLTLNADGSYSYVLDNANAIVQGLDSTESLTETFTYTLTDGDTDSRTTTLTITINGADDGITITGLNPAGADEIVYEANLSDGMSPDAAALTQIGSFNVAAQDGISVISVGGEIVFTGGAFVPGKSISTGYGTLTITNVVPVFDSAGDAVSATVSYSYTLGDNTLTHTGPNDGQLTDSFAVEVTDTDGTMASDAIEVTVVDDTPDAIDDMVTQAAGQENQPVTIDVFTNDVGGADGKVVGSVAVVAGSLKLDGGPAGGSLVNNGDGTFTYTPAAGESGTVTFDYSVADGDGDTDTATATIVLAADSTPMFRSADPVEVDEDGLAGANVDATPTLQTMPAETDGTENRVGTGTAVFDFKADVPAVLAGSAVLVDTAALDGQLVTLAGQDVVFKLEGGALVGRAGSDAGVEVIRIALTTATAGPGATEVSYGYTVTLSQPVKHATAGSEDTDLLSGVTIEVTDKDGDKTTGTFDVTVRDDVPTALDEAGGSLAEGATVTGTLDFVPGADGASVTAVNGTTLTFDPVTGFSQGVPLYDATGTVVVGTISVKADGSYSFTASNPLNNPVGATGTFTVTDGDGDMASAAIAFTVTDANAPTGGTANAAVDDDGLATGNPASTTFDLNTNVGDAEAVASEKTFEGTLTFTDGGDAPVTITFASTLDGSFATVGTERVQYSVVGNVVTATVAATDAGGTAQARSGTPLFQVEILDANAGTYRVTLLANVLHAGGPNEENPVGTDAVASIAFTVTDSDGSSAPTSLNVTFDDDAPSVTASAITATQPTENAAFTFTLVEGVHYTAGADGVDLSKVTFAQPAGAQGVVTYNGAGVFTYTPNAGAGSTSTADTFTFTVVDGDGDTATKTVNVALKPDSTPQVVNVVAAVDDDALGGNAGADAATDIDANAGDLDGAASSEATFRGQLTVDFGADGGTVSFANLNGASVMLGTEAITLAWSGTTLTGSSVARGTVFTVSLTPAGSYTVTLVKPVLHAPGGQETSTTLDLAYRAVDSDDGDTVETGKLTITFNDDVPTAVDDMVTQAAGQENQPVTIDVFTNDVGGADGKVVGSVAVVAGSLKLDGGPAGGSLVNNGDGTFTYTPAAGESGTVTFDYSVADGDGDTDTATATIVLAADSTPMFRSADPVEVDEDGLAGANVDATPTLQTMPAETDGTGNRVGTGTAVFDFKADVPAVLAGSAVLVDTAALDGQLMTLAGQDVVFKLEGGALVGRAGSDAGAEVIRIALTTATAGPGSTEVSYGYTVTLSQPVKHATAGSEDTDLLSGVTIEVTDKDGDKTTGSFAVTVRDDVPTALDEAGGSLAEGATVTGTLDFVPGADGASVTAVNGTTLVFDPVTGFSQGVPLYDATGTVVVGTISVKADGSYSFTASNPLNNPVGATGTFTVTDGDGDMASAAIAFTVTDANAPTGGTANAAVDDDGLATGNPASTTFDLNTNAGDAEAVASEKTFEGTLTFTDGGDAPVTITFASTLDGSFATVGTERVQYSVSGNVVTATVAATDAGGTAQARSGTPLFQVEILDANAGTYRVTLLANVLHAGGPNEENPVGTDAVASIAFTVTDSDGSSAPTSLTVTFDDDAPSVTGNTITATQPTENAAFTFTLVEGVHYTAGADGVDLSKVTFAQPAGAQGVVTYNGAGVFTYTPNAGAGSTSTADTFTFTVVDGDGDTATKTVNVALKPDSTPQVVNVVAAVDDDALGGNAGADAATDIDANAGDLDGAASSEATFRGQLTVDFGADGGTVSFANLNGASVMLGTEAITLAWSGTTLTGSSVARGTVFTVSLTPSGSYTVTLVKPVLHAPGGQETSTTLDLNYRAVDSDDADTVETGKLTITFNDDVPSAKTVVNTAQTDDEGKAPFALLSNEGALVGTDVAGSPMTATGSAGSLFTIGADGFGSVAITGPAGVMAIYDAGNDGDAEQEGLSYSSVTAPDGAVTLTATGALSGQVVFTLQIAADGSYTFTQLRALVHSGAGEDERNLLFNFTVTDKDGDPSNGSLQVTVDDDTPIANAVVAAAMTDDEGKAPFAALSIEGGTGDVPNSPATVTGIAGTLFKAGADGFGSLTITGPAELKAITTGTASGTTGASRQENVVYDAPSVAANGAVTLTARGQTSGEVVFTLTINNDGSYSFTQSKALVHSGAGEDDLPLNFAFTVTDGDGDTASGSLRIDVDDDSPTNFTPATTSVINSGTALVTGRVLDTAGNGIFDNAGADGVGTIKFAASLNGALLTGASGTLQSGGANIYTYIQPDGSLIASTDSDPSNGLTASLTVFTATLNAATGTYSIDFDRTIDNGSGTRVADFSKAGAGNTPWKGVDADLVNGQAITIDAANDPNPDSTDLLVTVSPGGTVNSDSDDIGVSNQFVSPDEFVRIDLVQDLRFDPGKSTSDPDGYLYDTHVGVTQATFKIIQVQSNPNATAAIRISATNVDDGNALSQSNVGDASINTAVNLDHTTVVVRNAAGAVVTSGITVFNEGNDIVVTGVKTGYTVTFGAEGNATFEAFRMENANGDPKAVGGGNYSGDSFAVGGFAYSFVAIGAPVAFNLPVVLTDGDGDTSTGSIGVTVNPVTPVVLDLDGDGVEFVGSSAGAVFDYNGDGNAVATSWAGGDDGILAFDANGNGRVDSGLEIVFGHDGMTDLEALAARYGDTLDANDADYTKFGVWQDANGNGIADAGEFRSLSDAGIVSISLVSDGKGYFAADGEVKVFGSSTFTRADGTTGSLADAAFATQARSEQRTAEVAVTAALAGAMLGANSVAAQPIGTDAATYRFLPTVDSDRVSIKEYAGGEHDRSATEGVAIGDPVRPAIEPVEATAHFRGETSEARMMVEDSAPASDAHSGDLSGAGEPAVHSAAAPALFAAMGTEGLMDALLSIAPTQGGNPALAINADGALGDALSDFAGANAIDAIVDHFAIASDAPVAHTMIADGGLSLLSHGLGGTSVFTGLATLPEASDDASMLAAAQA